MLDVTITLHLWAGKCRTKLQAAMSPLKHLNKSSRNNYLSTILDISTKYYLDFFSKGASCLFHPPKCVKLNI